jgi:Arc/MetJ-type ribon-helix-helix transcriptional regulator
VKLSVSLPAEDVAFLDEYAHARGLGSRSAAVQSAVRVLRQLDLERDYELAWAEWEESQDSSAWESAAADGLDRAPR